MTDQEILDMPNDIFEVLDGLRSGLNEANKRLSQIQDALFGNREFGQPGVISKLDQHEERLRKLERTRINTWQIVAVIIAVVGASALMDGYGLINMPFSVAAGLATMLVGIVLIFLLAFSSIR